MGDETVLERILDGEEDPKDLPLPLLQSIANDFSEDRKIGQGGFGVVYKGLLRNGILVAAKRMYVNEHTVDDVLFRREVKSLMKINHQNVVRFLGFCSHTYHTYIKVAGSTDLNFVNVRERLLCLEYINNGSLDKHITDELRGLEWETRYDIISGICKGLCHLKENKIIHMDLKPANILLDDHMIPKITDFGLSRPDENSHTMGQRFGTRGYFAPEYDNFGKTSFECDIYSLGVIIAELVTGRKGTADKDKVLRRWRHRWKNPPTLLQYQQVTSCINIAVRCREKTPEARPSIGDIMRILSESESTDGHTSQESGYLEDDMLGIEPFELHFTFKPNEEMSWSIKLTNKTKACFAFNIETPSKQYTIQPDKGTVTPGCNDCLVKITLQPQEWAPQVTENAGKFIVQSTKVTGDLRDEDIIGSIFHEVPDKVVDEVDLMVVYEKGSHECGKEPNVPVEAVSLKRKAINSCSYEDGARRQLDRRSFHPPENFSHRQPTNKTYLPRVSDRAMDVTRGAMGSLLHKLGELLREEFDLEMSVKEDIKSLSEELMKMHVVLHKMSEVQQDNLDDMVKHWASNVREMSYNLEDFVDGFLVHNEPDSNSSRFKELTHEMCLLLEKGKSHHPISSLIKHHISKQVQDEAKKHKEYNVDSVVANATATITNTIDPRMLFIFQHQKDLVGIQEPRDDLIKRLSQVDGDVLEQQLRIFSIYGPGILGKTTLVKAVYEELKHNFHLMAFVSVGRNPDKKQVLHDILVELDNNSNRGTLNEKQLIKALRTLLEKKRYFIVIDDIWDSLAWGIIKYAFPENNLGSQVVTTTRIHSAAAACCNIKYVYKMETLNNDDSRRLFLSRVFSMDDACPDVPEDILTVILKKCGGLPLAIISIASLVAKDPRRMSTWDYVRKSLIAMFEGDNPILTDMERILDLSYRHLPDHLKTCLLHVCMYPEDREIPKNNLLRQWLDEEDVAEEYFKELINMCMIQPKRIENYSNEVLSCRVHDIILDLMRSKSSEENFSHVTDDSRTWAHGEIRRISVHRNDKKDSVIFETIKGSLSLARSALFYYVSPVPYLLVFKYVGVLDICLGYLGYQDLDVTGITRLFQLRYLKISLPWKKVKLPDQIGELQNLETIDLKECMVDSYPSDIVHLPWLSHLAYGSGRGIVLPEGFERLKSLRTLEGVHLDESSAENIKVLGKLTNLRKLHICLEEFRKLDEATTAMHMDALHSGSLLWEEKLQALGTLGFLRDTYLIVLLFGSNMTLFPDCSAIRELDLHSCRFERCPGWISQLSNLHKFSVVVREVVDCLNLVSGLSSLAIFRLEICDVKLEEQKEESVVITGGGSFEALKELIFRCPKAALTIQPGAMPKLEKLVIWFRHEMTPKFLPVGIQHLPAPTLKGIWLCLEEGSMEAIVKGSKDWHEYKWARYCNSYSHRDEQKKHARNLKAMLKKAFKQHHCGADIHFYFDWHGLKYLGKYIDEEYYEEDDEEDDRADTRQLLQLIEEQKVSGRLCIETEVPLNLMVDTSLHLAVGSEGQQVGHGEGFAVLESLQPSSTSQLALSLPSCLDLTLALAAPLYGSPPSANISVGVNNDLLVQQGNMLVRDGDYYCSEQDDEAAYQGNGTQTSAQAQAMTRQLAWLIEAQQDYGMMSTDIDVPPVVDTSLHVVVTVIFLKMPFLSCNIVGWVLLM